MALQDSCVVREVHGKSNRVPDSFPVHADVLFGQVPPAWPDDQRAYPIVQP